MLCILSFLLICCRRCVRVSKSSFVYSGTRYIKGVLWRREIEAFAYTMIVINVCLWFKFEQSCIHWGVKFGPKQRENTVLVVRWCFSRRLVWFGWKWMGWGGCHCCNQPKNPENFQIFNFWLKTTFTEPLKLFRVVSRKRLLICNFQDFSIALTSDIPLQGMGGVSKIEIKWRNVCGCVYLCVGVCVFRQFFSTRFLSVKRWFGFSCFVLHQQIYFIVFLSFTFKI